MAINSKILLVFILFIGGCKTTVKLDPALQNYALADANKNYLTLVERPTDELSREQLYNRALTLWGTPYRELNLPTSLGLAHVNNQESLDKAKQWIPHVKVQMHKKCGPFFKC